jgi:hypothetical protein
VKVAEVAFAGTVTLAGTCAAAVLLLDRVTTAPPAGAGPVNLTVPVGEVPAITDVGLTLTPLPAAPSVGAFTVKLVLAVAPYVPAMVTVVLLATGIVVTVNVAVVAPAGTVTLTGTVAAAVLPLDSVTTAPPDGAGPFSVTVPVDEVPPITEVGLRVTEVREAAVTVKVADVVAP